jgi:succinyl-diaminopimelate desuccinylase
VLTERERVLSRIRESDAVRLLRHLVQIPSRNPPGEERELAAYVAAWLKEQGIDATLVPEPYDHRPQVVATMRGDDGAPTLVLNGHLDTVPLGEVERWSVNPFGGEVRAGRLYGRGACDMKGGLAAMMLAAKAMVERGGRLRGNLLLHFAVGEETSDPGTKTLLLDKGYTGDWGIVLEPTNLAVVTAEKGLLWIDVEIRGTPAHASTPELGVNPIEQAADFITRLRAYRKKIGGKRHPLLGSAVCSVTMIAGGIKENVVPGSCRVTLDRRLLPGEGLDAVEAEIQAILAQMKEQDAAFEGTIRRRGDGFAAAEISVDSPIAQVVREAVQQVTGIILSPSGAAYGTDARNFINDAHIPAIIFGPGDPAAAHTYDESIVVSQVVACAKILALTSLTLLT